MFHPVPEKKIIICICRSSQSGSGMRLTGDPQADADIMAFVKARQNILQQSELVCYSGKVIDNMYIVCSFGQNYDIDGGNLIL